MTPPTIPELVLVAGIHYPRYEALNPNAANWTLMPRVGQEVGRFNAYCKNWALRWAARQTSDRLRVTLFDFTAGERRTWISNRAGVSTNKSIFKYHGVNSGDYLRVDIATGRFARLTRNVPRSKEDIRNNVDPPRVAHLPGAGGLKIDSLPVPPSKWFAAWNAQDPAVLGPPTMSIADVYRYLQEIGSSDHSHTVAELHFFSHGWDGGPILTNTPGSHFPPLSPEPKARLLYDTDGRREKDFVAPNMTDDALLKFRAAFARNATVFIWGCFSWTFAREYIRQASHATKTVTFRFDPNGCWHDSVGAFDSSMLVEHGALSGVSRPMTVEEVALRITSLVIDVSYTQRIALALADPKDGVAQPRAVGALPGLGTTWDRRRAPGEQFQFMHVPMGGASGDTSDDKCDPADMRRWLAFYDKQIPGLQFDRANGSFDKRFGRGFAVFPLP